MRPLNLLLHTLCVVIKPLPNIRSVRVACECLLHLFGNRLIQPGDRLIQG